MAQQAITTGVLDTFNRLNGGLGSQWINPALGGAGSSSILTQLLQPPAANPLSVVWNTPFGQLQEVSILIVALPSVASSIQLCYRIDNPNISTWTGYQWDIPLPTSSSGQVMTLSRVNSGSLTTLVTLSSPTVQAGYAFGAYAESSNRHWLSYRDMNGVNKWNILGGSFDKTNFQSGYIGLTGTLDNGQRFGEFGGGNRQESQLRTPLVLSSGYVSR